MAEWQGGCAPEGSLEFDKNNFSKISTTHFNTQMCSGRSVSMLHSLSERQQICLQNKSFILLYIRTGFLAGAFNLKVVKFVACCYNNKQTTKSAMETEEHLLDLCSCPVAHLDVHRWGDGLIAVISCFLVLKLLGCESHNSAGHWHLRPPHTVAGTLTAQI